MRPARVLLLLLLILGFGLGLVHGGCRRGETSRAEAPRAPSPDRPSIVLFTLDTTRADHLGCYGSASARTPALDALARDAVRFTNAHATCPITLPSHASMLTGLYPFRHGVRENTSFALPAAADTLAEKLAREGYETAAFVASVVLSGATGIGQGFATFAEPRRGTRPDRFFPSIRASEVNAKVRAWWEKRDPARPFFLWIHYYDPHAPYEPPPEFAQAAASPYDGEISAADAALGEVLALLAPLQRAKRLLTIATADHGESLGFRGEPTHEIFVYEPVVRVPLLVRWPDGSGAGSVRDDVVSLVDLAPTILAAAGAALSADLDGVDLRPPPAERRAVYAESWYPWLALGWSPFFALITPDSKYIHSVRPELYAHAPGALEGEDRAAAHPDEVERLAKGLRLFVQEHLARGVLADARVNLNGEKLEQLRKLGYATVARQTAELGDPFALDPKLPVADEARIRRFYAATTPDARLPAERQVAELRRILADEPRNFAACDCLARLLLDQRRPDEAAAVLAKLLELAPAYADGWANLGAAHQQKRELAPAIRCYRQALEFDPASPAALANLAACLAATGATAEAEQLRAKLKAQESD
jgi:arylsulfatase A-like enzyme